MELKFTFTDQETNLILQSLGKQPFEAVAGTIAKIHMQAAPQVAPPAPAPAVDEAPETPAE